MNLSKLLLNSGIGCGKDCNCLKTFVESLDPVQEMALGHMIEAGEQKRHKKTKKALKGKGGQAKRGDLLGDIFGEDDESGLGVLGVLLGAAFVAKMQRDKAVNNTEPYTGDLLEEQLAQLAKLDDEYRAPSEDKLRRIIAFTGNDPSIVKIVEVTRTNIDVRVEKRGSADVATDSSESPAKAA